MKPPASAVRENRMPALMIDGKVVSAGKVLKAKEVEKLIQGR